jgi:hypothetical protein
MMPYIPLQIPPGVFRNGTKYQSKGRWYAADLVRWSDGVMQPIGGWATVLDSDDVPVNLGEAARGMLQWVSHANALYLVMGVFDKAKVLVNGVVTDITPAVFTTGSALATLTTGQYGTGNYGDGNYGEGDEAGATLTEANSWQFDNYGQYLVGCAYSDGQILEWDLNIANNLVAITNAPTSCKGIVVTPERMIVALAAGGDSRKLHWCDQDDNTDWTAVAGNTAGDYQLPGAGQIMCGRRMPNETLIFTDVDAWAMRYIGGDLIYSFKMVGANAGILSRQAVAVADGRAFWMGKRNFFMYDGFTKPIPCGIADDVFNDINMVQRSTVAAWTVGEFTEVWFSYPSAGSEVNNKIAVYNYRDNHFSGPWDLERTSGADTGPFTYPRACDGAGYIFDHERGSIYGVDPSFGAYVSYLTPSAESGPIEIGQGDRVMTVRRYIPDEDTAGDVDAEIFAALYPTAAETSQTVTVGSLSDVRITGRQVRLKIEQDQTNWRFGVPRLEVVPRGLR